MATTLKLALTSKDYGGGHIVAFPEVTVQLRRGNHIGRKRTALLDTGAVFTLARMSVAAQLGLDAAMVRTSPDQTNLASAGGGARGAAWGWSTDLVFGDGAFEERLVLRDARVYFTEWPLAGYHLLVGHHDAFERLTFSVLNHAPERRFVLRFPT